MTSPLFRAFVSRLFVSACTILAAFISLKLYSKFLSKEIYGVIFVSTQIIGYLPLTGAGFVNVLNQRVLTAPDHAEAVRISWFTQFLQNCIFLIAIAVALVLMAGYVQAPLVQHSGLPVSLFLWIGVVGALTFYINGQFSFLVGLGEQTKCYLLGGALQILTTVFLFLAFAEGLGVWAFPISSGLAALLLFVPLRIFLRARIEGLPLFVIKPPPGAGERFRKVWRPALDSLMTQGWSMLTFSLDGILVGLMVGAGPAAVYGVISRITGISRHVLQALGETAWPQLARHSHPEQKAAFMRKVDRLSAWNVGAWFGAVYPTIAPFLAWFLKADWVAGNLLIALILLRHAIISLQGPHVFGIVSLGLFRENAILARREVILSVIPAVILCHFWGTIGIAVGYLIGSCSVSGWAVTRLYFTAQKLPWLREWWSVCWRALVGAVLSCSLATIFWHLCQLGGNAPGWLAIIAGGLACALAWAVTGGRFILELRREKRLAAARAVSSRV